MKAPNIEMIAASLRSCSLGNGRSRGGAAAPADDESSESAGVTVELNSEMALPCHWEQCLDIRTGEVYYINWTTGKRTKEDPRRPKKPPSYYSSSEDDDDDDTVYDEADTSLEVVDEEDDDADDENDTADSFHSSGLTSISSSPSSSSNEATSAMPGGHILVAAGCKACFMYFMVPKRLEACPKCGGVLLHLGGDRSGYC